MSIEAQDIATHAATGTGGFGVAWLIKFFIKGSAKREEKLEKKLDAAVILLTRIDERVDALQKAHDRVIDHDKQIAVLESEMANAKRDLNGIGNLVRNFQQS